MTRRLVIVMLALALGPAPALAKPRWQELPLPPAMPSPTASGHVEIAGAQIYYASFGQGDPVILLHGGLGNGDHFAFQVPELAQKFRVIVIDSRHQGRSTFGKTQLTYHAMAADVIAVMDKLKLASAAIVGWSDGGEIGLDLAIVNPDRVTKLFILGANYDSNGSKPRGRPTSTFTAYTAKCRADYLRLSKSPKAYNAVIDSLLPVWRGKSGFTKEKLRAIKAPTVIADGDHDEIIELAQIKEMAQLIPNARLVVFENTSHFALWQDPAAFNKALLEFLSTP